MKLIKMLHLCKDSSFAYYQILIDKKEIFEYRGEVGKVGTYQSYRIPAVSKEKLVENLVHKAQLDGFEENENIYSFLILEMRLRTWGTEEDLFLRIRLQNEIEHLLLKKGLGYCDGGSIGTGSMEIAFLVVNVQKSKTEIDEYMQSQNISFRYIKQ